MELSKLEKSVIEWMRLVSDKGRHQIAFWAEAVYEAERFEKKKKTSLEF